jgi:hypothetical protein
VARRAARVAGAGEAADAFADHDQIVAVRNHCQEAVSKIKNRN